MGRDLTCEDFPRQPLSFWLSRRELLRLGSHPQNGTPACEPGRPALKLNMLGALTDGELVEIVPVLVPGCSLSVAHGTVWGCPHPDATPRRLFAAEPANMLVLEAINGRESLGGIAERLGGAAAGPDDQSFAQVRSIFLTLVLARLAMPAWGGADVPTG